MNTMTTGSPGLAAENKSAFTGKTKVKQNKKATAKKCKKCGKMTSTAKCPDCGQKM